MRLLYSLHLLSLINKSKMIGPVSTRLNCKTTTAAAPLGLWLVVLGCGALVLGNGITSRIMGRHDGAVVIPAPKHVAAALQVSPAPLRRSHARSAGSSNAMDDATVALGMTSHSPYSPYSSWSSPQSSPPPPSSMWSTRNPSLGGRDYYRILGVPRTAREPEIKQAFRRLVKQYHPGNVTQHSQQRRRQPGPTKMDGVGPRLLYSSLSVS
jgi:DnaJ domain